jgi:hypothetical protein
VARLTATLEDSQLAREKLAAEVQGLRAPLGESQDRLRTLEVELAPRQPRITGAPNAPPSPEQTEREARWQDELSSVRLEQVRERDRAQALAEQLERHRVESEARERREQRLQEELRAVAARADADREDTVRRAQQMVQAAEQTRTTAEKDTLHATQVSTEERGAVTVELEKTVARLTQTEKDFLATSTS